ncbi:MAG TPA: F0F1 ATP synthase subunit B [Verrucomicrobiales bacterium]|nr:F0F1 ATP synthase subunit B [Verrucomicrobiales bacterium]
MDAIKEVLDLLGITWAKFIAQCIIFLCVYFILKRFAFGPVMAVLEERRRRIADGEENLVKIRARLEATETEAQTRINEANGLATLMIEEAKQSAAAVGEKKKQEAIREANDIVAKAREASRLERDRLLEEMRKDFGRLVVGATESVTGKVLSKTDQEKINKEAAGRIAS